MTEKLLPCPFCGGSPTIIDIEPHSHKGGIAEFMPDHPGSSYIDCACGVGIIDAGREPLIARWNTRAQLSASADGKGAEPVAWQFLTVVVDKTTDHVWTNCAPPTADEVRLNPGRFRPLYAAPVASCSEAPQTEQELYDVRFHENAIDQLETPPQSPSEWSPSDLLFYGLADAVGVSVKIKTLGGGRVNHEFDRAQIKQLRAALRVSPPERSAAQADVRAGTWQPIANAPRDGTICDLWLTGGGRLTDQWWCEEDNTWCGLEEEMFTHWMKAPVEGPALASQEKQP